jgi:hypothetical protein
MKQTHRGSCHCGAVRFQCELDLAPPGERGEPELPGVWWTTSFRCNCTWCSKTRFWKAFVRASQFQILEGADQLGDYQFAGHEIHHSFCRRCGVHPFASSSLEVLGGDFYAVNVACLDDVTPEDLARTPITYEDGRNDAWDRPPPVTDYL